MQNIKKIKPFYTLFFNALKARKNKKGCFVLPFWFFLLPLQT